MALPTHGGGGLPAAGASQQAPPTVDPNFSMNTLYAVDEEDIGTLSILLQGMPGTGKTRLLGTAPLPLLVYSFDPKATIVLRTCYPELVKAKLIQWITFYDEDYRSPTQYNKWEQIWTTHCDTGYLNQFGTVAVDSFTTWMECAVNQYVELKDRTRAKKLGNLSQNDYLGLYNLTRTMIKKTAANDCNFVLTAHLEAEQNELLGTIRYVLSTYKGLKVIVPPLFSEKWVMHKEPVGPEQVDYRILTNDSGMYTASTQLKGLAIKEQPDIKALMEKAGLPAIDKPKFWEKGK